jgi:putative hydrolase of the HAD superfamily
LTWNYSVFIIKTAHPRSIVIMKDTIKAVLFDVDDTLFDRNLAQQKTIELIIEKLPEIFSKPETGSIIEAFTESDNISVEEFRAGAPSDDLRDKRSRYFLRLLGIDEDYAETITDLYVKNYPLLNTPVEGAVGLVNELSHSFKVGVVSNGLPDVQYNKLETLKLRNLFSCIVLSEEIGIRKPDPGIFHLAAKKLGVKPSECLYVGNSYDDDITGAKKAGMKACWFNRKKATAKSGSIRADFEINKMTALLDILHQK